MLLISVLVALGPARNFSNIPAVHIPFLVNIPLLSGFRFSISSAEILYQKARPNGRNI